MEKKQDRKEELRWNENGEKANLNYFLNDFFCKNMF